MQVHQSVGVSALSTNLLVTGSLFSFKPVLLSLLKESFPFSRRAFPASFFKSVFYIMLFKSSVTPQVTAN